MDRDEEKKNNPFEQDAYNETENESTAADAPSADHIQEDLSEEKEIEAEYTEIEETASEEEKEEEPIVEPAARSTMNKEERARVYNNVSETEESSRRPKDRKNSPIKNGIVGGLIGGGMVALIGAGLLLARVSLATDPERTIPEIQPLTKP